MILICTVGGSPAPLVSAIAARRPDRVVFVCSDGANGTPSSRTQVDDIVARAQFRGAAETLDVPVDDPDRALLALRDLVSRLRRDHPGAAVVADYTGGTKSMSAALMHVGISAGLELQFMVGRRSDLNRVEDGTERPALLSFDFAVAERTVGRLVAGWQAFGYEEAASGFADVHARLAPVAGVPPAFLARVAALRDLSAAFAAWDRFDHEEAARLLAAHGGAGEIAAFAGLAVRLAGAGTADALTLADLWRNAERCAARGRYDDAVARCYRLVEATAQWLLRAERGIDTGALDAGRFTVAEAVAVVEGLTPNRDGMRQADLSKAWKLVDRELRGSALATFMRAPSTTPRKSWDQVRYRWVNGRNYSILAHGFAPIGAAGWRESAWIGAHLLPAIAADARRLGQDCALPQLPGQPPRALTD